MTLADHPGVEPTPSLCRRLLPLAPLPPLVLGLGQLVWLIFDTDVWQRVFFAHLVVLYLVLAAAIAGWVTERRANEATRRMMRLHILQSTYHGGCVPTNEGNGKSPQ